MIIGFFGKLEFFVKIFVFLVCCWVIFWICMYVWKGFKLIDIIIWFLKCRLGWVNVLLV